MYSMKNLLLINAVRSTIDADMRRHEDEDHEEELVFLRYVPGEGLFVPFGWIDKFPEFEDKWHKFMYGQTVVSHGFWVDDVTRFLNSLERQQGDPA